MKSLTLKSVNSVLSLDNITVRKDGSGDYVVRVKGSPAGEGYFTNDLQDAYDTGRAMAFGRMGLFRPLPSSAVLC